MGKPLFVWVISNNVLSSCNYIVKLLFIIHVGPVAIDCGVLLTPANGAVDLSDGSLVGAVAIYTCDPSFRLIGVESRICQKNGSWSGEAPVCQGNFKQCTF